MVSSLWVIFVSLALAFLLSSFFKRMGLPRVLGQLLAGIILGVGILRTYLFDAQNMEVLSFLADLGIILLFFYAGLETNFKNFSKKIRRSVLVSLFNTLLPLLIGFLVMRWVFHFDILASIVVGISLSVSALSVSVDILEELKMLKSKIGNSIITIGAVDDVIELLLVTLVVSFLHGLSVDLTIPKMLMEIGLLSIVIIIARLWLVPFTLKFVDREKSSTSRFLGSLRIILLFASLSEVLGIGSLIGAMIAGILIRQTIFHEVTIPNWEQHDIVKSIHIIAFGFLIPLFFVWVGVNVDVTHFFQNLNLILALTLIAIIGTVGGTALAVMLDKGTWREGVLLGWGLNPKGDVELVIAVLALKSSLITLPIFSSLVIMSLLTTFVSPIMFKRLLLKYHIKGGS